MEFITLLLSGHLILIFVTAFSPDENLSTEFGTVTDKPADDFNLSDDILPTDYDTELVLDIKRDMFHGSCNISINILKDTENICLHSANLNITNSTLITKHGFKQKLRNVTYINRHEIVSLDFGTKLLSTFNYTLHIAFMGIISNTGGLFKTSYINKEGHREWLIAKHNSVIGTRRLFPCWDEPRFKANFSINLKHHNNYTISTNIVKSRWREKDMIVVRFATTPAIPTYFITIVLMRLSLSSIYYSIDYTLLGRSQVKEHLTYAANTIRKFTQAFENEWLLRMYLEDNYLPEQHIAFPGWLDDGMDKWHVVLYREANIIYNDEVDPIARKIEISRLIARKVAGQWIGSAIYSSQWSNMWLQESISTLLGINVLNKTIPDFRMTDLFVVQTLQESLRLDNTFINNIFRYNNIFRKSLTSQVNNISEINSLFSFAYYLKGPVVLRMLQHILGNEVFQEGINIYLKMQLSSLDNFWTAMQDAYYNKKKDDFNIKGVIGSWMNQNYYPVLNVSYSKTNENPFKLITLSTQTANATLWIPVSYNTQTHINFNDTSPKTWINQQISLFVLDEGLAFLNLNDDWVIFNLQQTGYYRVNYCTKSWRTIINYLSSKNYTNVHVLNRAQMIDDAFYFMIMDQLEPSIFWKLTNFLSQESDYIVWYPMFKAIEYMSCSYPFQESQAIKANILNLLSSLLHEIGYQEHSEDNPLTKCLRQEAAKWACVLGDDECQSKAKTLLSNHLSNPKIKYFWPWWKEWTYCHGLSTADVTIIDKVYETYSPEKNNTKTLELLSCSNNYIHVLSLLKKVIEPYNELTRIRQNIITRVHINMFYHILQRHAKNEEVLGYILSNWEEIKPKLRISLTATLIVIINHVYSLNHLDKIRKFIENTEIVVSMKHLSEEIVHKQMINEIIKTSYVKTLILGIKKKIDIRLSQIKIHSWDYFVFK